MGNGRVGGVTNPTSTYDVAAGSTYYPVAFAQDGENKLSQVQDALTRDSRRPTCTCPKQCSSSSRLPLQQPRKRTPRRGSQQSTRSTS